MKVKIEKDQAVYLENPWSGHVSTMTWGEVVEWANENVHIDDRMNWILEAKLAALSEDAKTLGAMIIGS